MIGWGKTQINLKKTFINLKSIDIRLYLFTGVAVL